MWKRQELPFSPRTGAFLRHRAAPPTKITGGFRLRRLATTLEQLGSGCRAGWKVGSLSAPAPGATVLTGLVNGGTPQFLASRHRQQPVSYEILRIVSSSC